jgi:hypothetical protein
LFHDGVAGSETPGGMSGDQFENVAHARSSSRNRARE